MPRNPPDPALVELALAELRSGSSPADVAAAAGVSEACIKQWRKRYGNGDPALAPRTSIPAALAARAASRAAPPLDAAPPTEPPKPSVFAALAADATPLARNRAMQAEQLRLADEAFAVGNYSAAQRAMRDASNLSLVIARIEKEQRSDNDLLHISRADIAAARASYTERVRALLARPLLCAHCSKALSVAWVEEALSAPKGEP